ncbi:cytochrome P450-like protein [Mycena galopus ATCC 62051]|nr:cytochrome P450-like protein [Mycena galopus ATCC 62051]
MVLPNIWAMIHDEMMYGPHPDQFDPERFFNANSQLNTDDRVLAFGFGRRTCAGHHTADATIWATVVSVLSTFNISKAKDETGKQIEIDPCFTGGLSSHPMPFTCTITPWNDITRQLITDMADA